jgi:ribosomal protein L11 methyltransferase
MIELFPEGFEEVERQDGVELVAYTDSSGEEKLWHAFGAGRVEEVPRDWESAWRRFHRPVRVGRLWIGPPWETPDADAVAVVIDPGRAFGTGAHPTTRLCLELLAELERGGLLDIGCGSGVLSIAAAKLGYAPLVAVDQEAAAIDATRANAAANGVSVDARQVDALSSSLPSADVVVANIALAPVEEIGARVEAEWLVTSGYLQSDTPALPGWRTVDRRRLDGWAADLSERIGTVSARSGLTRVTSKYVR